MYRTGRAFTVRRGGIFAGPGPPTSSDLTQLTHTIAQRIGRFLECQGILERDAENSYLVLDEGEAGPMDLLRGHSIVERYLPDTCEKQEV